MLPDPTDYHYVPAVHQSQPLAERRQVFGVGGVVVPVVLCKLDDVVVYKLHSRNSYAFMCNNI